MSPEPTPARVPARPAPPPQLAARDVAALRRFLSWTRGGGFHLAVVEAPDLAASEALVAWLAHEARAEGDAAICLALDTLPGESPWRELRERLPPEPAPLILHRLEERLDLEDFVRRLNVQRDGLTRDLPRPWILVIHPHARRAFERCAPDLADFVTLWVLAPVPLQRPPELPEVPRWRGGALRPAPHSIPGEPLAAARRCLARGDLDGARDRLGALRLRALTPAERAAADVEEALLWADRHAWPRAEALIEAAAAHSRRSEDPAGQAHLEDARARLAWRQGALAAAQNHARRAQLTAAQLGARDLERASFALLTELALDRGDLAEAEATLRAAEALTEGALDGPALTPSDLAGVLAHPEHPREAWRALQHLRARLDKARDHPRRALRHLETCLRAEPEPSEGRLASLLALLNLAPAPARRRAAASEALALALEHGDRRAEARARLALGALAALDDPGAARAAFEAALTLSETTGDLEGRAAALRALAALEGHADRLQRARSLLDRAWAEAGDAPDQAAATQQALAQVEARAGRRGEARRLKARHTRPSPSPLRHATLVELSELAASEGVDRDTLLSALPPALRARLPRAPDARGQHLSDALRLARLLPETPHPAPLRLWIEALARALPAGAARRRVEALLAEARPWALSA